MTKAAPLPGEHGELVQGPPWILGHRGAPREAPENTLSSLRRALELDPTYATAHQWLAMNCLIPRQRFDQAGEALEQAADLDPMSLPIQVSGRR